MTQYPDSDQKDPKQSCGQSDKPHRSKEEITKEYIDTCTAYGDLQTRIFFMKKDLELIEMRLVQLTEEAAQTATGDTDVKENP